MAFGQVLLVGFHELHGLDADVAVALAVNHALLESGEGFGPSDRHRVGAEGLVSGDEHGALRNAELQASDVSHGLDGLLGVGDPTEVGVGPAKNAEAAFLHGVAVEQFVSSTVGALHHFVKVVEEVGEGEHAELLHEGHDVGDTDAGNVESATANVVDGFSFVAELAGEEELNFILAIGLFFNVLLEGNTSNTLFGIGGVTDSDLEDLGGSLGGGAEGGGQGEHEGGKQKLFHKDSLAEVSIRFNPNLKD